MVKVRDTWRALIEHSLKHDGATWDDVVACTLSESELDTPFDSGYGSANGTPFTLWTETRVYFPAVYEGAEWCESVPRHPCDEATLHVGG